MTVHRVALTTTRDRAERLASEVTALGMTAVFLPCIEYRPAPDARLRTARALAARSDRLLITSPRTVTTLWSQQAMPPVPVAAVGSATAAAVRRAGGVVDVVGDGGTDGVIERLGDVAGQTIFYPHAAAADLAPLRRLQTKGGSFLAETVYHVTSVAPGDDEVDAATFASPTAVTGWSLSRGFDQLVVGAIGQTTRDALSRRGVDPQVVPSRPQFDRLLRLIASHLRDRSPV